MMSEFVRRKGDAELIVALAAGQTIRDAAAAASLSERTVTRRLQEPAFRQEVANTRTLMLSRAVGMLADAAADAVMTLRSLLHAESDTARLGAARAILDAGPRLRESEELAARIEAIEAAVEMQLARGNGGTRWSA